jgi:radical SAM superfamily enzyme YgiQ (UPF0313 family)
MRILLAVPRSFNPKQMYREYPLGVGFLGTILKECGHEVSVFDENVEDGGEKGLSHRIEAFKPEIVGFSIITPNYPVARKQIQELKRTKPSLRIIAGGVHASLFPEDIVADGADVVVRGEAEATISGVVDCLQHGRHPDGLPGVTFRNRAGETVSTSGWSPAAALDELSMVDRSLYRLDLYSHHVMLASRGCPHRCAFCCNYTGTVRNQGVAVRQCEQVVAEMKYLRDAHGAKEIFFADDIFLLHKRQIARFCQLCIDSRIGVRWIGQMRADRIDLEVATLMAEAGCQRLYFGVESGSARILAAARKGMTKDQIRAGVKAARDAGLRVKTGWIYGLPGTLEDQYAAIGFMLDLRPHEISIHQLIPFPGTVYYAQPERYGIRIAERKAFESFCYGGLDGNIQFDYLSHSQLVRLLEDTAKALEAAGYVSSDRARPDSEYVYTTPLNSLSMNVFRSVDTKATTSCNA